MFREFNREVSTWFCELMKLTDLGDWQGEAHFDLKFLCHVVRNSHAGPRFPLVSTYLTEKSEFLLFLESPFFFFFCSDHICCPYKLKN